MRDQDSAASSIWVDGAENRLPSQGFVRDDGDMTDAELIDAALITVARTGITLDTLAALLLNDHGLSAYCPGCRRWAELDLARLVREGHGRQRLQGFKPRCRACGRQGQVQLRPPTPTWGGASWGAISRQ